MLPPIADIIRIIIVLRFWACRRVFAIAARKIPRLDTAKDVAIIIKINAAILMLRFILKMSPANMNIAVSCAIEIKKANNILL